MRLSVAWVYGYEQTPEAPARHSQLANLVGRIATGEVEEEVPEPVDELARKRGEARAAKLSPEERSEIAGKAVRARWGRARWKKRGVQRWYLPARRERFRRIDYAMLQ